MKVIVQIASTCQDHLAEPGNDLCAVACVAGSQIKESESAVRADQRFTTEQLHEFAFDLCPIIAISMAVNGDSIEAGGRDILQHFVNGLAGHLFVPAIS